MKETPEDRKQREQAQGWITTLELADPPQFPQPFVLPIRGRKKHSCQLMQDYEGEYMGVWFKVPAGFITDLASIPQAVWSLGFSPFGLHNAGSVPHDWLYSMRGIPEDGAVNGGWPPQSPVWSRRECDAVFLDRMLRAGVSQTSARIMHAAVRLCGWLPWMRAKGPVIEPLRYDFDNYTTYQIT